MLQSEDKETSKTKHATYLVELSDALIPMTGKCLVIRIQVTKLITWFYSHHRPRVANWVIHVFHTSARQSIWYLLLISTYDYSRQLVCAGLGLGVYEHLTLDTSGNRCARVKPRYLTQLSANVLKLYFTVYSIFTVPFSVWGQCLRGDRVLKLAVPSLSWFPINKFTKTNL